MPRPSKRKTPKTTLGPDGGRAKPRGRPCEVKGCREDGEYRAPSAPDKLDTYIWFCLDHVREYNKAWNYCAGRSDDEIETMIREDMVGWRPTWPLGRLGGRHAQMRFDRLRDEYGLFDDDDAARGKKHNGRRRAEAGKKQSAVDEALDILDLSPPVTPEAIKAQYIILVKRHHPDANGGDKAAEERLKLINQAYETLKETLNA
jgi:hypothetical protein